MVVFALIILSDFKDPIGFDGGDTDLFEYMRNDPVNAIDPWGLKRISFNGVMRSGLYQIRTGIYQIYDNLSNKPFNRMGEELTPDPLNESVEQLNDNINWQIDHSGLEGNLNASPWHPMMWEKDAIWWTSFAWYWDEDAKFS